MFKRIYSIVVDAKIIIHYFSKKSMNERRNAISIEIHIKWVVTMENITEIPSDYPV